MAVGNVYIGSNAGSVETSDALGEYSRVVITSNGKAVQWAGDTSGRTLTVENPYASSNGSLAANMLAKIKGYNYQPMTVTNARTSPTAEIGDGMTANGTYSGIYSQSKTYGHVSSNTVAAGNDEEINHEFPTSDNSKYATYTGLAAGTTVVNGSGLKNGSVTGTKVASKTITGGGDGNLADGTVSYGNTMFTDTLDQVGINKSDIAVLALGKFNTVSCITLSLGDYYIKTDGSKVWAESIYG